MLTSRITFIARIAAVSCLAALVTACGGGGGTSTHSVLPPSTSNSPAFKVGTIPATVSEFSAGDALPEAIAVAEDGNPWFLTEHHVNRITPTGTLTPFVGEPAPEGSGPALATYSPQNDITIGPDRAVWFTADGSAADVNPLGCMAVALARIPADAALGTQAHIVGCPGSREHGDRFQAGIVAGPNSTIWMVDQNATGLGDEGSQYQEIGLDGKILLQHNLPAPCTEFASFNPYIATGIVRGIDGAFYVVAGSPCGGTSVSFASSAVIRIDASGKVTNVFLVPDAIRIAAGPDGNLWVTQNGATNAIARVTPRGTVTEFPLPTSNAEPLGIAAGNDGAIWFAENNASKIGRISTAGAITEYPTPTANSGPFGVASLPGECAPGHGLIWFTEARAGKVGKIEF